MSVPSLRVVRDADVTAATKSEHSPLRPTSFDDFIGQSELMDNLRGAVRAAKRGGWQLDHMLIAGPAGTGKTSCAGIVAAELGVKLRTSSAPAIEHKGALASLLTTLDEGDVLFIDEIHALDRALAETIYSALEDRVIDLPAGKRVIRVPLPKFTLLGATTHAGKLPKPLLDRFGFIWQLRPYTLSEMQTIVSRSAGKLGITIDEAGALVIARASRGTPRIANRLVRRLRDVAANAVNDEALPLYGDPVRENNIIDGPMALAALAKLGLDHLGLDHLDRRYLALVADRATGIEAICAALGEERITIESIVEPNLARAGLIQRSGRGRVATSAGISHLRGVKQHQLDSSFAATGGR